MSEITATINKDAFKTVEDRNKRDIIDAIFCSSKTGRSMLDSGMTVTVNKYFTDVSSHFQLCRHVVNRLSS
jgi:hypothetical protein